MSTTWLTSSTRRRPTVISDEVRRELYDRAVDSIALRLRMAEVYEAKGLLGNRVERLRDVAGVMAQFASELLGVSSFDVWAEARETADAIKG